MAKTHYIGLTEESWFADLGEHENFDEADQFAQDNFVIAIIWLFNKTDLSNDEVIKGLNNES